MKLILLEHLWLKGTSLGSACMFQSAQLGAALSYLARDSHMTFVKRLCKEYSWDISGAYWTQGLPHVSEPVLCTCSPRGEVLQVLLWACLRGTTCNKIWRAGSGNNTVFTVPASASVFSYSDFSCLLMDNRLIQLAANWELWCLGAYRPLVPIWFFGT